MSFLDKAKDLVGDHAAQVKKGIDKAEDLAEKKLGTKYKDQIESAGEKAEGFVDQLKKDETP